MKRIGIDVGGTGIQFGVVNEKYEIIAESSIPTHTSLPFEAQVKEIADAIEATAAKADLGLNEISSVGVGIPGIASDETGEIIKCTNMGWHHVPFRTELSRYIDRPIFIDNDANVAALGESVAGVCAGASSSVFITIGTGIGSGIILNGRIWKGAHGIGGELGHVILDLDGVPCTCGNRGCLERYCSATALIRMGKEALTAHPESAILSHAGGNAEKINAKNVMDAAREGDAAAVAVYERYTDYLAQAIASVVNLLDPEVIVLGGGVSRAGDFLLSPLREKMPRYVIFNDQPLPELRLAVLGASAGIIGASMLS